MNNFICAFDMLLQCSEAFGTLSGLPYVPQFFWDLFTDTPMQLYDQFAYFLSLIDHVKLGVWSSMIKLLLLSTFEHFMFCRNNDTVMHLVKRGRV